MHACVCVFELWGWDLFLNPDWLELRVSLDSSSLWLSAWRLCCCLSGLYLWWLFSYCSLWEDMKMASLVFTPEWRDLCPSGLPPQILPQLQFTSVTWGGEFSVVSAEHVVRTLLSTNPHCDIFVASFFFSCCYCAYHGWDLKFFVCTLLDTFTRIGALRADRWIPSIRHRLFPEGAALSQLRTSIAVAEQHHLSRQAPVPAPAIAVGYRKPPVFQGNKTLLFSPITDTRYKAHHFLRTALQTLPRVRTVERQCAKILLEQ